MKTPTDYLEHLQLAKYARQCYVNGYWYGSVIGCLVGIVLSAIVWAVTR